MSNSWARWQWQFSVRRRRLWIVPVAYFVGAVVLAALVSRVEKSLDIANVIEFDTDAARDFLSAIASGMFAFTGIVFSMAFLLVQFGSTAYSPRLAGWFFADRVVRHSLGVFSATVLYSVLLLLLTDPTDSGSVAGLGVLIALAAVLLSILSYFALIHRIARLQISNVLQMVGDRGREVIDDMYRGPAPGLNEGEVVDAIDGPSAGGPLVGGPPHLGPEGAESRGPDTDQPAALPPPTQVLCYAGGPVAIQAIDFAALVRMARRVDAVIEVDYGVGDTVPDGAEVLVVRGGRKTIPNQRLRRAFTMGTERTIEQDPKYAIRLITDIAVKALSPAVNDPTTAIQALDQLDDLLRRLGTSDLHVGVLRDAAGARRVVYPAPTWDDFLALAIDEIRLYGATSIQVARRLGALLLDLEEAVPPPRRPAVRRHAERARASIARSFADPVDREDALVMDRQGLGLGRESEDSSA